MYSDMGYKALAEPGPNDTVDVSHFPPYWTVILSGRDHTHMVNMKSFMEEYDFPNPVAKHNGAVKLGSKLTLKMPFLTNSKDLAKDDVLVLPFDGGLREIFCERFPPITP